MVDHDPAWAAHFDVQRRRLSVLLAPWINGGIHHVGSTAVPGLAAKPIVDIMAGVASLEDSRTAIPVLEADGWLYAPYKPQVMHWFCRPSPARREFHLHLVPTESTEFAARLAFRDALRADPHLARRYEELKRSLAERHCNDREAYTEAKGRFIAGVLASGTAAER